MLLHIAGRRGMPSHTHEHRQSLVRPTPVMSTRLCGEPRRRPDSDFRQPWIRRVGLRDSSENRIQWPAILKRFRRPGAPVLVVVAATGRRSVRGSIPDIPVAGQQALQFIREAGYLTGDLTHLLGQLLRQARIRIYRAANNYSSRPGPRSSYDLEPTRSTHTNLPPASDTH